MAFATIQISVTVLDEKCKSCQCMSLNKVDLYGGTEEEPYARMYTCGNLHMCNYIRNRIVRGEAQQNEEGVTKNGE